MAEPRVNRKLAAILSADVVGYSKLMADDEAATVDTLKQYRAAVGRVIERHKGRVVNAPGDNILAEFASAVEAVQAAVEIQRSIEGRNVELPEERRMRFRVGLNLGDVIEEDDGTIYGDGVNIAARMEALADEGGICISSTIHDAVEGKLDFGFDFLGERPVKNIEKPVRVYRVRGDLAEKPKKPTAGRTKKLGMVAAAGLLVVAITGVSIWQFGRGPASEETETVAADDPVLALPTGPSIAVLPFQNMSGKSDEDWFSDGMTETLITDLSRLNNLFVIARNSTFTYKGKPVDVRRVGQELGVRYVLEGSVQRTDERLRVNAQLVDAQTGQHLWAERYDRKPADVFEIQDDITQRIVTELDVKLLSGEQVRDWRKTTRNRQAYDLALKCREHYGRFTREDMARAQALCQQALDLDRKFTMAMVWLGETHVLEGESGWSSDSKESYRKALALGRRAIAIDPTLGGAYAMMAIAHADLGEHANSVKAAEKALSVSPNQANILALSAWAFAPNGRAEEAVSLTERAFRLNPFPPLWYYGALGDSLLYAKRFEEAVNAHRKCVETPDHLYCQLGLTVAYVEVGKLEQATTQAEQALSIDPNITAENNVYMWSAGLPEDRIRIVQALRQAGLK
jgi:adenylate cyclase